MSKKHSRREFIKTAAVGGAALALTAQNRARAQGANERLAIGVIGCGQRGRDAHMRGVNNFAKEQNVEIVAVCDPWRQRREQAAALTEEWYGRRAQEFVTYRDLLAMKDLDAVMIASCDHQHITHLLATAEVGKDVYCEKPLGMDLEKTKKACDAVKEANLVCQIGTQIRSLPTSTGCRDLYQTGVLGKVSRVEQRRNGTRPYWYARLAEVNEADVDWDEFLMDRPKRPFNPSQFTGWYGYREFSGGPIPGLASHFIDLMNFITGTTYPTSVVCSGGTYTWIDEHQFDAPDLVDALWQYPEGFMVSYSTNFGNGCSNALKIIGDGGVMDLTDWNVPWLRTEGTQEDKRMFREDHRVKGVKRPDHMLDWLQCIRTRNTPNASIDAGLQHAVAVIMAMEAYDTGQRQVYDAETRTFKAG